MTNRNHLKLEFKTFTYVNIRSFIHLFITMTYMLVLTLQSGRTRSGPNSSEAKEQINVIEATFGSGLWEVIGEPRVGYSYSWFSDHFPEVVVLVLQQLAIPRGNSCVRVTKDETSQCDHRLRV